MDRPGPAGPGGDGRVLVLGLGNLLLRDEGVGVRALRRLEDGHRPHPALTRVDGGTAGLDLLPLFAEYRRILLLDAVAMDRPPGHCAVIRNAEILTVLSPRLSVHHLGLCDVLGLTRLLDYPPTELALVGMVPRTLDTALDLSPEVAAALPRMLALALGVLDDWGLRLLPGPPTSVGKRVRPSRMTPWAAAGP
jgi:hydrogenase maturation protease